MGATGLLTILRSAKVKLLRFEVGFSKSSIVLSNLILFAPVGCLLLGLKVLDLKPIILVGVACLAAILSYMYIIRTDTQFQMVLNQFELLKYVKKESVEK